MSHYMILSIVGAHVKNANKQIEDMVEVTNIKYSDLNYDNYANEVFEQNICNGILAIYSINAAFEGIIDIIFSNMEWAEKNFWEKINFLKGELIIEDNENFSKIIELREYRNTITHWQLNESILTAASIGYLPYMFGDMKPNLGNLKEVLISNLTKEALEIYLNSFNNIIKEISCNEIIKKNTGLVWKLESIMDCAIFFEG